MATHRRTLSLLMVAAVALASSALATDTLPKGWKGCRTADYTTAWCSAVSYAVEVDRGTGELDRTWVVLQNNTFTVTRVNGTTSLMCVGLYAARGQQGAQRQFAFGFSMACTTRGWVVNRNGCLFRDLPASARGKGCRARFYFGEVGVDEVLLRQWPLVPSEVRVSTTCSDAVGTTTRSFECRAVPEKGTAFYDFRAWAEL